MRNVASIIQERAKVNEAIRGFFAGRGYTEVETPLVVRSPDLSSNLTPFETFVRTPEGMRYEAALITSPEFSMKKLLGLGCDRIFSLAKVFRNDEAFDETHNPEFTMLEWYQQGADYKDGMNETEGLIRSVLAAFGKELPPFRRLRVREAILERTGIDTDALIGNLDAWKEACASRGIHTDVSDTESDYFYRLFLKEVETDLGPDPVFVYDYPKCQAALAKLTPDGKYGERFELYVGGVEFCNAFTELVDPVEQRARFAEDAEERKNLGKTPFPVDEELLTLLPSVRQPTFGNALGVDRLHMCATGKASIKDVIPFPASELFKE